MRRILASGIFTFLLLAQPTTTAAADEKPAKGHDWPAKMRELRDVYGQLMADLTSDTRFEKAANRKTIEKRATRLAELARSLHPKSSSPEKDLSIPLLADLFQTEASTAAEMLKRGNRAYARTMLKSIGGACVACHSRVPGADLSQSSPLLAPAGSRPVEAGEFYSATRQFDRALQEYDSFLSRNPIRSVFDFDRAARSALALAIRVKDDPTQATKLVNDLLAKPDLPYFLAEPARTWKKELAEWSAEKPKKLASEDAHFDEAKRLFTRALSHQRFPADRSADVAFLRATKITHEFLNLYPRSKRLPEALLMLGSAYEALGDVGVRDFHETYYVACIRIAPHTATSRKCYERYEESVYLGFTGSGGTFLPADIRSRMNELEVLSNPIPQGTASPSIRM